MSGKPNRPADFLGLSDAALGALSRNATLCSHPANALIINEGDRTEALYLILSGRVKVYLSDGLGHEIVLNQQGPGACFGEMVLDDGPRSASVITLEPCRFLMIPRSDVRHFLGEYPEFAMHLVEQLIFHVRRLTEKVKGLALQDVYERLMHLLYELAEETDGRLALQGRPTQQDLASRIGASREMVSRLMKDLTSGGYLVVEEDCIVIARKLPPRW
jgi:CRP/FNR family cyclic AMP-dependent transcriptional regulator